MDLLERDHCFEQLSVLFRTATTGNGRTVLVSGEAGIGKTALVETPCWCVRHSTLSCKRGLMERTERKTRNNSAKKERLVKDEPVARLDVSCD